VDQRFALGADSKPDLHPGRVCHGFLALTETVQFLYKCSDFYAPGDEHGILWSDPDLGIQWNVSQALVSEKDAKFPTLAATPREWLPQYPTK